MNKTYVIFALLLMPTSAYAIEQDGQFEMSDGYDALISTAKIFVELVLETYPDAYVNAETQADKDEIFNQMIETSENIVEILYFVASKQELDLDNDGMSDVDIDTKGDMLDSWREFLKKWRENVDSQKEQPEEPHDYDKNYHDPFKIRDEVKAQHTPICWGECSYDTMINERAIYEPVLIHSQESYHWYLPCGDDVKRMMFKFTGGKWLFDDSVRDGKISNCEELFIDYEKLGTYDSNGDGIIDKSDQLFGRLMVFDAYTWKHNSLSGEGIESISVQYIPVSGDYVHHSVYANGCDGYTKDYAYDEFTSAVGSEIWCEMYNISDSHVRMVAFNPFGVKYQDGTTLQWLDVIQGVLEPTYGLETLEERLDLADEFTQRGHHAKAMELCHYLYVNNPDDTRAQNCHSCVLMLYGKYAESNRGFLDTLRQDPENINAMIGLGENARLIDDYGTAMEWALKAQSIGTHHNIPLLLANIYNDQGYYTLAEKYYKDVISLDPENINASKMLD